MANKRAVTVYYHHSGVLLRSPIVQQNLLLFYGLQTLLLQQFHSQCSYSTRQLCQVFLNKLFSSSSFTTKIYKYLDFEAVQVMRMCRPCKHLQNGTGSWSRKAFIDEFPFSRFPIHSPYLRPMFTKIAYIIHIVKCYNDDVCKQINN